MRSTGAFTFDTHIHKKSSGHVSLQSQVFMFFTRTVFFFSLPSQFLLSHTHCTNSTASRTPLTEYDVHQQCRNSDLTTQHHMTRSQAIPTPPPPSPQPSPKTHTHKIVHGLRLCAKVTHILPARELFPQVQFLLCSSGPVPLALS